MPARKPHRKSRTGCIPCKKRHIKCGEERPNCLNCLDYDLDCHFFGNATVSLRDSLEASSSTSGSGSSTNDPTKIRIPAEIGVSIMTGNDELEVSDLELMHFFSTVTYATMSNVPLEQRLWQTTIINIGLQHNFLLRGLLAHSAVHLSYLKSPPDSISYLIKASSHQDIALSQFRKALDTIDASTFDAVLAFSCLLPIHSIALAACSTTRPQIAQHEQDNLTEFLKAVRLFRSVNKLLLPSLSIFTTSTILPLLQITTQQLFEADTYPGQHSLNLLQDACCSRHASPTPPPVSGSMHPSSPDRNTTFCETINELRLTFSRIAHPSSAERFTLGIVLIWTIVIPEGYMGLIDNRDPGAMAVLAHFAAVLCRYQGIWWLSGLGSSMVGIIAGQLGEEWRGVMEWPRHVADGM